MMKKNGQTKEKTQGKHLSKSLYESSFEHDACGIGFVANINGNKNHQTVSDALTILENMEHRGACGAEPNTGDGAGIMIQTPHEFFFEACLEQGVHLPAFGRYGVGMAFFPKDAVLHEACREVFHRAAQKLGLELICWRKVPVNNDQIGSMAAMVEPAMEQVFLACPDHLTNPEDFERKLFVLRNYASELIKNSVRQDDGIGFYLASLSYKTIVYKGQLTSLQVRHYFQDLMDNRLVSAFGLVHSRFATNTFPSWKLAQPFRYIAHNGEINTLQGNLNWLKTSEQDMASPYFTKAEMDMLLPIVTSDQSDSACLDNIIEMLTLSGRSLPHVMMMLIPEAWDGNTAMDPVKKAFYEFHAAFQEPWDGPAAICFTDGNIIGATLDRNGLRPSRYCITHDDRVIMASETGVLPIAPEMIKENGRLQPGKMFVVDMQQRRVISDEALKREICAQQPYSEYLERYKIRMEDLPEPRVTFAPLRDGQVLRYQKAFGYTSEDLQMILEPMALEGKEPVGSMGSDIPLAILSAQPQHLSSYFKQLFAQVTNPPIDPIRERMVMSLANFVGNLGNALVEDPKTCHVVALPHPVLTDYELEKIRSIDTGTFQAKTLQMYFMADGKPGSLQKALNRICQYAEDAVHDGFQVIVLTDRAIDSKHAAIPSLLFTSAIHHHLIKRGLRGKVGIIVEAGDVAEVHHYACLLGFGATGINPYLALATISEMKQHGQLETDLPVSKLEQQYIKAVNDGLLKVFSKMGISTLQSYQGAQIFEILGLNSKVVDRYFKGTVSRIEGLGLDDIARETLAKHFRAFGQHNANGLTKNSLVWTEQLPSGGVYQWKRQGEFHLFNPTTIHLLQFATRTADYTLYKKYAKAVNEQSFKACTLRSLLAFKHNRPAIPLHEVEPAENIYKRFATGAMSFGSISWEAHTTLALAMNILGGKSNTGEGGEDDRRYLDLADLESLEDLKNIAPLNGNEAVLQKAGKQPLRSAIKQVASGRFGVTSQYLTEAAEIQIKMAQGAKPGEGGQLPGHKVDDWIGKTRHATPGVGLISPPPHHDIYSIEDLAQLIFDLKNANQQARINVKLVSKAGVGTIAAGVVKAKADVVLIAGHDGGTGASPLSSTRHAGLPWELGLAEAQQTLVQNKLRSRVVLQADGQMKTGRDLAVATLLGAEEWGVATAALVVEGCILMRKCHLNTCPVGIATQNPDLRARFTGAAEHVVTFFKFLAEDLREIMAELGFRTIDDMVGQADCLEEIQDHAHWKLQNIDLSRVLYKADSTDGLTLYCSEKQDHGLAKVLDRQLIKLSENALVDGQRVTAALPIKNTDRAVGTMLSNEITRKYQAAGLPEDSIHFKFCGTAGQSFGAFAAPGLCLELEGDANDYFGKGLSGAKLIAYPHHKSTFLPKDNSIIGNVAFYGATAGEAYVRGRAGERFCVRNSGAKVVVEGCGDHGCEYMTGGIVVVLGTTGRNFGAGMSGGFAYVWDVNGDFAQQCNHQMIDLEQVVETDHEALHQLLQNHARCTSSSVAQYILNDFEHAVSGFVKVFPKELKKAFAILAEKSPVKQPIA